MNDNAINKMKDNDLTNYIVQELYKKVNDTRDAFSLPKLYRDECVEMAVKDYFNPGENGSQDLEHLLKEVKSGFLNYRKMLYLKT
jgi:hypothetical protein